MGPQVGGSDQIDSPAVSTPMGSITLDGETLHSVVGVFQTVSQESTVR